jgi:SSS family solute:Na+ symporter
MTFLNSPYLALLIMVSYLAIALYIGLVAWRRFPQSDQESYLLGGRLISGWVTSLTLQATQISALTFLGFVGFMYLFGVSFWQAIMAYLFTVPLLWILFNGRIWKLGRRYGHVTMGDAVAHYFGHNKWVSAAVGLALLIAIIPYVQTQLTGLGYVIDVVSGGLISFDAAVLIIYVVMIFYVLAGGMRAVAYTDTFQGMLILAGIIGGGVLVVSVVAGSPAAAFDMIASREPKKLMLAGIGPFGQWTYMVTWAIAVNFGWPSHPHMWNKLHIARQIEFMRYMPALHMLQVWLIFVGTYFISVAGLVHMPGLTRQQAETLTVDLFSGVFVLAAVALVAAGGVAAMMSTVSSQIHAVGTVFTRDFMQKFKPGLRDAQAVFVTRVTILVYAALGLALVFLYPQALAFLGAFSAALGVQVLPAAVTMLTNQKWVTAEAVIVSTLGGLATTIALGAGWLIPVFGSPSPAGVFYGFWALVVNVALLLVISAVTRTRPPHEIRAEFAQVGW